MRIMEDKLYYVNRQLERLGEEDQAYLRAQVDGTDWSIMEALKHIGGE